MAGLVVNWKELAPAIVSLLVWLFLNCSLNFYNKWLFSHTEFKFPVFFTMFHMIANLIGTSILIFVFKQGQVDFSTSGKHYEAKWAILLLASLFCTNIVTNNWSLMYISLSVNQIVKSCLPIPTIILSMMFEGKTYSTTTFLAIAVIVSGSIVAVLGNVGFEWLGFSLAAVSTLCVAAWTILSSKLLDPSSKLNSTTLVFYGSVPSLLMLLCLWYNTPEYDGARAYIAENPSLAAMYISIGGGMACVYNIFHFLLIKFTSTVTSTVAGNIKIVLVICLSVVFLEKPLEPTNFFGLFVFWLGVTWYTYIKYLEKMAAAQKAEAPKDVEQASTAGATENTPLTTGTPKTAA